MFSPQQKIALDARSMAAFYARLDFDSALRLAKAKADEKAKLEVKPPRAWEGSYERQWMRLNLTH